MAVLDQVEQMLDAGHCIEIWCQDDGYWRVSALERGTDAIVVGAEFPELEYALAECMEEYGKWLSGGGG